MILDTLSVYAYDWSPQESYGRVARELATHLGEMGYYVNCMGPNAPKDKPIQISMGGIALGYPTTIRQYGSLFNAGPQVWITAFESDALPFLWADIFNSTASAVVTPSLWCADVFRKSGVEVPVHAISQGVSSIFRSVERRTDRPFTFLAIADRGRRKRWDMAGFAFVRAFGDDMNYRMVFKSRDGGFNLPLVNPNMEVLSGDFTDEQMLDLYGQADVMVFPGDEGFGLPPREFAATNGIAMALDWGGTKDDLPQWGLPIAVDHMEKAWRGHAKFENVGQWAVPDIDDMATTMRQIARHRDYYRQWAKQAGTFAQRWYDWKRYAEQISMVWKEACSGKRTLRTAI